MSNVCEPEDVKKIKEYSEFLSKISDDAIDYCWTCFSTDYYSAVWVIVDDDTLKKFDSWIRAK